MAACSATGASPHVNIETTTTCMPSSSPSPLSPLPSPLPFPPVPSPQNIFTHHLLLLDEGSDKGAEWLEEDEFDYNTPQNYGTLLRDEDGLSESDFSEIGELESEIFGKFANEPDPFEFAADHVDAADKDPFFDVFLTTEEYRRVITAAHDQLYPLSLPPSPSPPLPPSLVSLLLSCFLFFMFDCEIVMTFKTPPENSCCSRGSLI